MYWQLNRIQYPIYNLGAGSRAGIWVQGCSLRCHQCLSPSLWNKSGGKAVFIPDIVNLILEVSPGLSGITISGGEPFEQYEQLIAFSAMIKQKTELTIFSFSGYYLDELIKMYPDRLFIKYLDYLLDGRYAQHRHEDQNIRGSNNQTLYQIVDGSPKKCEKFTFSNKWSVAVDENQQIFMAGIPKKHDLERIINQMGKHGFNLRFD